MEDKKTTRILRPEDHRTLGEFDRLCSIDAIPAGDILDAIVAERVMGWFSPSILWTNVQGYRFHATAPSVGFPPGQKEREYKTIGGYAFYTVNGAVPIPKYSTEVAAAWEVMKAIGAPSMSLLQVNPRQMCLLALRSKGIDEVVVGTAL